MRLVQDATDEEIDMVANNLRESDKREIRAGERIPAPDALWRSWEHSQERHGIRGDDGHLVGVCGVCPDAGAGEVWMLGTDELLASKSHQLQFPRLSRQWVDGLVSDWRLLHNWVYAANSRSIQWLRFLGFTVFAPEPHGPYAELFRYFAREAR